MAPAHETRRAENAANPNPQPEEAPAEPQERQGGEVHVQMDANGNPVVDASGQPHTASTDANVTRTDTGQ